MVSFLFLFGLVWFGLLFAVCCLRYMLPTYVGCTLLDIGWLLIGDVVGGV